ncbi:MAG: hypothetical protein V1659_05715, partial [Candidatus Woesearchaeota archaeon]
MGYPFNGLVAPAVLWDNPGITREEFVHLLDQTHSSSYRVYKPETPWDYFDPAFDNIERIYHSGLEGLARLLGLSYTKRFLQFHSSSVSQIDEHGLVIYPPRMIALTEEEQQSTGFMFRVLIHRKNSIGKPERIRDCSWSRLSLGDIWTEPQLGDESLVARIFAETHIQPEDGDSSLEWEYDMEILPITAEYDTEHYKTEEDLWDAHPDFHPINKFNWDEKHGHFRINPFRAEHNFLWSMRENRYYFDERTFDLIPASIRSKNRHYGYTDLVLTREALRHRA